MKTLMILFFLALSACAPPDNSSPYAGGPNPTVDPDKETATMPIYDITQSQIQNGNYIYEGSRRTCSECHGYFGEGQSNGLVIQNIPKQRLIDSLSAIGNGMPTYSLNQQQIDELYSYIQSFIPNP